MRICQTMNHKLSRSARRAIKRRLDAKAIVVANMSAPATNERTPFGLVSHAAYTGGTAARFIDPRGNLAKGEVIHPRKVAKRFAKA